VSFMSGNRVKGGKYSFEADFWGLGITLICAVTGVHPYDISNGLWILMKDILESPQPELDASFDPDLRDFVHACLNATPNDSSVADRLLQHPLLTAAKARGVIADDYTAKLPNPPANILKASVTEAGIEIPTTLLLSKKLAVLSSLNNIISFPPSLLPLLRSFLRRRDKSNRPSESVVAARTLGRGTRYTRR
jgi:serine/threonine protein kinase